jgi:adenine-specific DNA-methyltransferase
MVTITINPKGVTQGRFSRVYEYAFFCFLGNSSASGRGDDLLTPGAEEEESDLEDDEQDRRPRWKGLLRSGTNARRKDRKKMFYPVLIDPSRGAVVGTGETLPFGVDPKQGEKINGHTAVWPIRKDGSFGNWGVGYTSLRRLISKGYVALGEYDERRSTWAISYLSKQPQDQIASGILTVVSYDKIRNVVDVRYGDVASRRIKTVWHRSRHDAGVGGTDVLRALLGNRSFPFPKSVYAVYDCLAALLRGRPDALIVDCFAGSGTTLHATALLNAKDGGNRRCVLVTNNELDEEAARHLAGNGLHRGDAEYESQGVFELVTRPRCEAVITGRRPDGSVVPGEHLDGRPYGDGFTENVEFFRIDYLDPDDVDLGRQFDAILPALWLAAGGIGDREAGASEREYSMPDGSTYGVLFRESAFRKFKAQLAGRPEVTHVWLVTDSEEAFAEMCSNLPRQLTISMLYRDYLRNFRINTQRQIL